MKYEIACHAHATARVHVEADNEEHAEELLDKWLEKYGVGDLDWESDWIDFIDIMESDFPVMTINHTIVEEE